VSDFPFDPHFVTESDTPPVIVLAGSQDSERGSAPHRHRRGQLFGSTRGLLTVGLDAGVWVMPATHAVWVPPQQLHWARSHGPFSGYAVYVAHDACADLPPTPGSIRVSGLLREAVMRAATWPPGELDERVECGQRGCSSMVEQKLPKLTTRVRFPSPAPAIARSRSTISGVSILVRSVRETVRSLSCRRAATDPYGSTSVPAGFQLNGRAEASQAYDEGSIPFTRSSIETTFETTPFPSST
jgi:hypothetical protein